MTLLIDKRFAATDAYMELVRQFPLRPIRRESDYKAALQVMRQLAVIDESQLDAGQRDYLDALDEFISAYDRQSGALRVRRGPMHMRLKHLLQDSGKSPSDLEKILRCGRTLVSLLLNGKRELSKENIRSLSRYFKLSADYFL